MIEIDLIIKDLQQLAKQFRVNDEFTALRNIQDVLNRIISDTHILINCDINSISNIVTAAQNCQLKSDWLGLADYLEYDLVRAISESSEKTVPPNDLH